jgi:outer membrane protein assembly factor BamA
MKHSIYLITIILCFTTIVKPNDVDTLYIKGDYSVVIDSIVIKGNDQTEAYIILRELNVGVGDTLTPKLAEYNSERIYSLGIFNFVHLRPFETNQENFLLIDVEESWYLYPLPFITLKDRDWDKISYGIGVLIKNFRGRNETLRGRLALGFDPSLNFSYNNPNLSHNLNLFLDFQIGFNNVSNRSEIAEDLAGGEFTQDFYFGQVAFGKRFGLFHRFGLSAGYNYIESPFYIEGINASDQRIDRTVILGAFYNFDTRDLIQFPTEGMFIFINYDIKGMGIHGINYRVGYLDFREYRKVIGSLSAKWRLAVRHTSGDVPYYDYSYLGFNTRIRGHWTDQTEGNDLFFGSLEFDYYLVKDYRLDLYWIPLLPKSLLSYRVGLAAELFVDTGTTRFIGEPLTLKQFNTGYGAGMYFLMLPYFVFRLDLAFDEKGNSQWIFDLGTSF